MRIYFCALVAMAIFQRHLLYFPTHKDASLAERTFALKSWTSQGLAIGYAREVVNPKRVWLMLHGNGGQAIDRTYALNAFSDDDSVYILEYPGYGGRPGSPSKEALNTAAKEGYEQMRQNYPLLEVNVLGESLGSGVACSLAALARPPDRIVLVVPFDRLASVAQEKFRFLPVGLMLFDRWDNLAALANYRGRVDIYGATEDVVIPLHHAQKLAASVQGSHFHVIPCGHNEWSSGSYVDLR